MLNIHFEADRIRIGMTKTKDYLEVIRDFVDRNSSGNIHKHYENSQNFVSDLGSLFDALVYTGTDMANEVKEAYKAIEHDVSLEFFNAYLKEKTNAYEQLTLRAKLLSILEDYALCLTRPRGYQVGEEIPGMKPFYNDIINRANVITGKKVSSLTVAYMESLILGIYTRALFDLHRVKAVYYQSKGWSFNMTSNFKPDDVFSISLDHLCCNTKLCNTLCNSNTYVNTINLYNDAYTLAKELGYVTVDGNTLKETNKALVFRDVVNNHIISVFTHHLYSMYLEDVDSRERGVITPGGSNEPYTTGDKFSSVWYEDILFGCFDPSLKVIRDILTRADDDYGMLIRHIDDIRVNVRGNFSTTSIGVMSFYTLVKTVIHNLGLPELRRIGLYSIDMLDHALEDVVMKIRTFRG